MASGKAVADGGTDAGTGVQRLWGLLQTGEAEHGGRIQGNVLRRKAVSESQRRTIQPRTVRAGRQGFLHSDPLAGPGGAGGMDGILLDGGRMAGQHAPTLDGTGRCRRVPGPMGHTAACARGTLRLRGLWSHGRRHAALQALQRGHLRTIQQRGRTERGI